MNIGKKDDEAGDTAFFYNLDKSIVLQECRAFNETPINSRKCRITLTKLVYLLYQSEHLQTKEATEAFFSITKLFQSADVSLRQMVYLGIKELANVAEDVIIVTSSLTKDINAKTDVIYRPNAIRALCKITDSSMIQSIERFLKQAIVDRNPSVSSAALVSALHLFQGNKEAVKRWVNEVQEALNSKGLVTQYHALGLLYLIKQHDRMSVLKLIQSLPRGALRSPHAYCMLIRYTVKMMEEGGLPDGDLRACYELLENWLRHKSDMVVYEAARAICHLAEVGTVGIGSKELFPAVNALQVMLVNHRPALRFAAIRTLNRLALSYPVAVSPCNLDMENLITDANRSVATLAITTLLKTGNEASVDRLMKQITGFMSEISDEFKVIVVDAIRSLCLKFPQKQGVMLNFLSSVLRDEGGYEYKKAIVEAIFDIVRNVPESRDFALSHLCEFIEDCEFTKLAVRILHLLGVEGPRTAQPSKYIRYIYNRVILENATVRAAAVASLARFAVYVSDLRERIRVLLTRCLDDMDDEVRDRAVFFLRILDSEELCRQYIANETAFAWPALEYNLVGYLNDASRHTQPFDMSTIPVVSRAQEDMERQRAKTAAADMPALKTIASSKPTTAAAGGPGTPSQQTASPATDPASLSSGDMQAVYAANFEKIPQLATLGMLFKSSKSVPLTESETEYVVSCVKHTLGSEFTVFQFNVTNTLPETQLERVIVAMAIESTEDEMAHLLKPEFVLPIDVLKYGDTKTIYVVFRRPNGGVPVTANFNCALKYLVKEVDTSTGDVDEEGYEDEYVLEDIELVMGDYMLPIFVTEFARKWDDLDGARGGFEAVETYALTAVPSIRQAVTNLLDVFGMATCENTEVVQDRAPTHQLLLSGVFVGGVPCLARCRMLWEASSGVALEVAVRSKHPEVSNRLVNAVN